LHDGIPVVKGPTTRGQKELSRADIRCVRPMDVLYVRDCICPIGANR